MMGGEEGGRRRTLVGNAILILVIGWDQKVPMLQPPPSIHFFSAIASHAVRVRVRQLQRP